MFSLPDLPYSTDALEPYIDAQTMELHHSKHHAAYVKNLNDALSGHEEFLNLSIEDLISDLEKIPESVRTKVRNNGGGHANHSLFWQILAPNSGGEPEGQLANSINSAFGSFLQFQEQFKTSALGRFGSGWAWLVVNNGKLEICDTPNQDSPLMEGKIPILGLDVWEHAYYLKYQNRRVEYIDAWWNVVNWSKVGELYESALTKTA